MKTKKTRLARWLMGQPHGAIEALARKSEVSRETIRRARDSRIGTFAVAERISKATHGAVTADDLLRGV